MTNDFQRSEHAGNVPQRKRHKYLPLFIVFTLIAVALQTLSIPSSTASAATVVLVGAGDIASCDYTTDTATAKLLDNISGTVFTAGDNVYTNGTYTQYKDCYGPTWGRHKSRTKPSPGNHEYNTSRAAGYFQYFNNVPSYYAYNLGDWRIYALNSNIDVSATSAQVKWLKNDLADESQKMCPGVLASPTLVIGCEVWQQLQISNPLENTLRCRGRTGDQRT